MNTPVIGVCAAYERASWGYWDAPAAVVASSYLDHIERAGGLGIALIPMPSAPAQAARLAERIDGLLLIGGVDVHPHNYGEEPAATLESTGVGRDAFELAMVGAAFARDLPLLGICRGLQLMNVARGGTLHQHLDDAGHPGHREAPGRLDEASFHEVDVTAGSWAAAGTGAGRRAVNSHHHQGINRVSPGAVVTAVSVPGGLPEALEWPGQTFALGVQWHPEAMELSTTIAEFVAACGDRADRGEAQEGAMQ